MGFRNRGNPSAKVMFGQTLMCAHCGQPYESKSNRTTGGRPSLYCSVNCRVAANRAKKAQNAAEHSGGTG